MSRIRHRSTEKVGQLPFLGKMPGFEDIGPWINSDPLTSESLAGKVVLVDFWTYSCVNCLRTVPYLNAWHKAYAGHGLTIIGVHTPEFEFEKGESSVISAISRLGIRYPVVLDDDYRLWYRYRNRYWPAHYFFDALGNLRAHHFGEGDYGHSEEVIRKLLVEAGNEIDFPQVSDSVGSGYLQERGITPETYLGYNRMEYMGSPESVAFDGVRRYSAIKDPAVGVLYLDGQWELRGEYAIPREAGARILYRVFASQVNLVMAKSGRVLVRLDGQPISESNRGEDCRIGGESSLTVSGGMLYNLIDTKNHPSEHLVEVTFLDPGTEVYAFTFG